MHHQHQRPAHYTCCICLAEPVVIGAHTCPHCRQVFMVADGDDPTPTTKPQPNDESEA